MTGGTRALERTGHALARLDRAASRVPCPDLVLYRTARVEAIRRGEALFEHAPGVPAVDTAELPAIAAVLRGEAWLAEGRPGGWRGLLCGLHWELMQARAEAPGSLRSGPVWLGSHDLAHARRRFPEASAVPRLLAALEHGLDTEPNPLLAAARAHADVALAHPFRDGNGRVAQALVSVVLRERGVLSRPCLLLGTALHPTRAYVAAMDRLRAGDSRPWIPFFLSTMERAAGEAAAACETLIERLEADELRLSSAGSRRLLRRLAAGALPLRGLGRGGVKALETLQAARIARIARGLFREPVAFYSALARLVAG